MKLLIGVQTDSGSEDEMFYTPPSSPSEMLELNMTDDFEDSLDEYRNYLLGFA